MKEQLPNMNEQPPKFPEKAEIDKAINNFVEQLFKHYFFNKNKEEKIKTIFSTEIREYQSLNNNSSQSLDEIAKQALQSKTMAFLNKIKQQKQYNGNKFVIDYTDKYGVVLKTNDGKQKITLIGFVYGSCDDRDGLCTHKPPITPIIKSVNGNKCNNTLEKFVPDKSYNKSVCIGNTFNVSYSNEKEYENNKIDDTWITFNKDDKGQINNIKLSRQWLIRNNDGCRITQDITEIKLQDNNISQIDEYRNVYTEQYEGWDMKRENNRTTVVSIKDNESIEGKIKSIFGNKNDIAIQNILHELDEEQRKAITNDYTINVFPKSSSSGLDQNGYCPFNICCNCNLDCLNCFSGIFNSKG